MNKRLDLLAAAVLAVGGVAIGGSNVLAQAQADTQQQQPQQSQFDSQPQQSQSPAAAQPGAGQSVQSSGQQPGTANPATPGLGQQPSDDLSGSAQTAGAQQHGQQEQVGKVLSKTAKAILSDQGAKDLSQHFSSADQDRLKDMDTAQVDQSVQQLRQAYKEKFQKDLSFDAAGAEAGSAQVINSDFFRIDGGMGEAQPAGSQLPPDTSSTPGASSTDMPSDSQGTGAGQAGTAAGTSGGTGAGGQAGLSGSDTTGQAHVGGQAGGTDTSGRSGISGQAGTGASGAGASASGSGDLSGTASGTAGHSGSLTESAQTAGSSSTGENMSITIPESHGVPEAKLNLVREAGDFKIDIPDNMDGQQLSQKLKEQVDQCLQMKDQWPQDATEAARAISHGVFIAFGSETPGTGAGSGEHRPAGTGSSGIESTGGSGVTAPGTSDLSSPAPSDPSAPQPQ